MKKLFATHTSNKYRSILLRDFSKWPLISKNINRTSMLDAGFSADFEFDPDGGRKNNLPDICTVYLPGVLAFKEELKDELFPESSCGIELLPITVSDEPWLLLNCLQTVSEFDAAASEVLRGLNGEIYSVLKIRVTDPKAQTWDIFTFQESNRGQLFVTNAFRERVGKLGLKGIDFKEIGEIV
ncbi:hypothetical protein [Comamonas endophytica]|uniref:Uncharacterized protein n=2 Tax=Comamonas endophytica TaxID=2949090 RepID=A0ABY6GD48_9BURK|nr:MULTISPECIES: hypothetical protein [unclassified Acidovorax]MCD2513772.1 hypothetical protein [Acidovorax sp. D4N7]UYG52225.1 hypothetical protein M9799_03010 [Acidovorax sp. 5MLIR]